MAFVSVFALIGVGLLVALITGHYQRWRTGKMTLSASPTRLTGGETVTLTLQMRAMSSLDVTFNSSSISTRPTMAGQHGRL